uniref:Putative secreted protein n=1 Tax=Ixodes ricinus TaxID=34613 RepID=A0A6B0V2T1_IXORI
MCRGRLGGILLRLLLLGVAARVGDYLRLLSADGGAGLPGGLLAQVLHLVVLLGCHVARELGHQALRPGQAVLHQVGGPGRLRHLGPLAPLVLLAGGSVAAGLHRVLQGHFDGLEDQVPHAGGALPARLLLGLRGRPLGPLRVRRLALVRAHGGAAVVVGRRLEAIVAVRAGGLGQGLGGRGQRGHGRGQHGLLALPHGHFVHLLG